MLSSNVTLFLLSTRIDKDNCDPTAFNFLKSVFLPPNVKNCLAIMNLRESLDQNADSQSDQKQSHPCDQPTAETCLYQTGFMAIQQIPSSQVDPTANLDPIARQTEMKPSTNMYVEADRDYGCSEQAETNKVLGLLLTPERPSFEDLDSPNSKFLRRSPRSASAKPSCATPAAVTNAMSSGLIGKCR